MIATKPQPVLRKKECVFSIYITLMIELTELNISFKVPTLAGIAQVEIANIYLKRNIFLESFMR